MILLFVARLLLLKYLRGLPLVNLTPGLNSKFGKHPIYFLIDLYPFKLLLSAPTNISIFLLSENIVNNLSSLHMSPSLPVLQVM